MGVLELEHGELRERLEQADIAGAATLAKRDALRERVRERDKSLDAEAAYNARTGGELAEHRTTIELLRREVGVLRRQVDALSKEETRRTHARERRCSHGNAGRGGRPRFPDAERAAGFGRHRNGPAVLRFRYRVSLRSAAEESPDLFEERLRLSEEEPRRRRARTDPPPIRGVTDADRAQVPGVLRRPADRGRDHPGGTTVRTRHDRHRHSPGRRVGRRLPLLQHPRQVWPCLRTVNEMDGIVVATTYTLLDPEGRSVAEFNSVRELKGPLPTDASLNLVWVAGSLDSPYVIAIPSPTSWKRGEAILVAHETTVKHSGGFEHDELIRLVRQARTKPTD
ncbi:hypothetical protein ACFZBU_40205 [Embleya sp. NPDC008237]|uniref:hypothetical protein n=1 Tax=Embleya sp. NPDC008237 TaxID=3363978 RepID=UPI0036EFD245